MTFTLEPVDRLDKRAVIRGPVDIYVDIDDGIPGGDAGRLLAEAVVNALNLEYTPPGGWFCTNEDCGSQGQCVAQDHHDHDGICFECHKDMIWDEINP